MTPMLKCCLQIYLFGQSEPVRQFKIFAVFLVQKRDGGSNKNLIKVIQSPKIQFQFFIPEGSPGHADSKTENGIFL